MAQPEAILIHLQLTPPYSIFLLSLLARCCIVAPPCPSFCFLPALCNWRLFLLFARSNWGDSLAAVTIPMPLVGSASLASICAMQSLHGHVHNKPELMACPSFTGWFWMAFPNALEAPHQRLLQNTSAM
jgi:hypothetical protein